MLIKWGNPMRTLFVSWTALCLEKKGSSRSAAKCKEDLFSTTSIWAEQDSLIFNATRKSRNRRSASGKSSSRMLARRTCMSGWLMKNFWISVRSGRRISTRNWSTRCTGTGSRSTITLWKTYSLRRRTCTLRNSWWDYSRRILRGTETETKYLMEKIRGPKRHDQWNIVIVGRLDWRETEFWWYVDPKESIGLERWLRIVRQWNFKRKEMFRN